MKKKQKNKNPLAPVRQSEVIEYRKPTGGRADAAQSKRIGFDLSYLFSALLSIAVAAASVGLVFYFAYHLINSFRSDVTTSPAYDITESEYRRASGYIFRSEAVVEADVSGIPDYKTDDGARVGIGDSICDIYSSVTDEVRIRTEEIDREIAILESVIGSGVVQTGLPEALADANEYYNEIMEHLSKGEYLDAVLTM